MRYKFLAVYNIVGLNRPVDGKEKILVRFPSIKAKASVVYELDDHLFEFDRASTIGFLMLQTIFNRVTEPSFEERLANALEQLRDKRKNETKRGVFALFEADGEVESFNPRSEIEMPEFIIAKEGAPKDPIRDSYQTVINGFLASFALGSDRVCGIEKLKDGVVFFNKQGKPVYSYTSTGSGKMTASITLTDGVLEYVEKYAKSLGKHQDLVNSSRLLTKSLHEENDELQSFLSVWSGLEILVDKAFKKFEKEIFERPSSTSEDTTARSKFFQRVRSVMKGKYGLTDQFSAISFELAPESAEQDIKLFEKLKNSRNRLIHGKDVATSSLPTDAVQKLLRKYLTLYIQRVAA